MEWISDRIVPKHIAIIPDGNRRWAKEKGISKTEGYAKGIAHIEDVLGWCRDSGVKMVTMWGFSTDNFKRDKEEVSSLFELFRNNLLKGLGSKDENRKKIRIRFLGRLDLFPKEVTSLIQKVEESSRGSGPFELNLLLSYGGREEILDAVNRAIELGKKVDEESFSNLLYTKGLPDPDLVIRTSGEKRLSGLLPWQTTYSEFFFTDKYWPDFSKEEFEKALDEYSQRKRRFGK